LRVLFLVIRAETSSMVDEACFGALAGEGVGKGTYREIAIKSTPKPMSNALTT